MDNTIVRRLSMGLKVFRKIKLNNPVMVASWPGIGNIGLIAIEYLRQNIDCEPLGEIEPWDFFYPGRIVIKSSVLEELQFPASRFYLCRGKARDIILFIGDEQPHEKMARYAKGGKAYEMAQLVIDMAERFNCGRIYTSGAAVALLHHSKKPRVLVVPNTQSLIDEIKTYQNTTLLSEIQGKDGQGAISGLNGLLLGVARERGFDALCIMGEIPVYLQGMLFPYPKASLAVLEVLSEMLSLEINFKKLVVWSKKVEQKIDQLLEDFNQSLPIQLQEGVKEGLDKLRITPATPEQLTADDARKAIEEIEKFFKTGGAGDEEKPL